MMLDAEILPVEMVEVVIPTNDGELLVDVSWLVIFCQEVIYQ